MARENTDTKAKKSVAPKKKSTNTKSIKTTTKAKTSTAKKSAPKTVKVTSEAPKKATFEKQIAEVQAELTKMKAKEAKAVKDAELFRLRFNSMLVVIAILIVIIIGFVCWNFVEV